MIELNIYALIAVGLFAAVLFSIFGALYYSALKSNRRGEMAPEGLRILRWALLGQATIYVILGITAFLI